MNIRNNNRDEAYNNELEQHDIVKEAQETKHKIIRTSKDTLSKIKKNAQEFGIPYQTLIRGLLHQLANSLLQPNFNNELEQILMDTISRKEKVNIRILKSDLEALKKKAEELKLQPNIYMEAVLDRYATNNIKIIFIDDEFNQFAVIKDKMEERKKKVPTCINLLKQDLEEIKRVAHKLGFPYQVYISSILHKVVNGKLK